MIESQQASVLDEEDTAEATRDAQLRCATAVTASALFTTANYGLTAADGLLPTLLGQTAVGYQNRIQSSGSCLDGPDNALLTACVWDRRVPGGVFFFQSAISVPVSKAAGFIRDVQRLRDLCPEALCGL